MPSSPKTNAFRGTVRQLGAAEHAVVQILSDFRDYLFRFGPVHAVKFCNLFRQYDANNTRTVSRDRFCDIMQDYAESVNFEFPREYLLEIFGAFRDGYAPTQLNYDDFLAEIKVNFTDTRRQAVRAAWRKLDPHMEGLVDMEELRKNYNVARYYTSRKSTTH